MCRSIKFIADVYSILPMKPCKQSLSIMYRKYLSKYYRSIPNKTIVATRDGLIYQLDLAESIDRNIYVYGYYETETKKFIEKFVKPGMVVLDIGANIGAHTLKLAKIVGPHGLVIAFEPMSYSLGKLKTNLELNAFENVQIEKLALSDRKDQVQTFFNNSWRIFAGKNEQVAKSEEIIEFIKLDEYVETKKIERIDFIKLDVDGYELKVLKGAKNSLIKFKPFICIELCKWTLNEYNERLDDLMDFIISLGYLISLDGVKYFSKDSILNAVSETSAINALCVHT